MSGWEGADWYAGPGNTPDPGPLSWGKPAWFENWRAEHTAAREDVIVMDMSFMSKFMVQGRDAGKMLDWISAGAVDGDLPPGTGRVTYTQWLDEAGKIQADLTVTKLAEGDYFVVASDTVHRHVKWWMDKHIGDQHVFVADMTSAFAQINIQGPRSRELLQSLTKADLSNEAFAFRDAKRIEIGFARALCLRITYAGELGFELYVPTEQAVHVYDRIAAAGAKHAGLKALASLRMEKGYRDYGHDIDNTDSVLEAGLGFAVDLKKPNGFLGKDAVLAKKAEGPLKKRIVQVLLKNPEVLLFHAEIIRRDGVAVGYVRAASYGFTVGGAVGLAMIESAEPIDQKWLDTGDWDVEVAGKRHNAVVSLKPLYDPTSARVRA